MQKKPMYYYRILKSLTHLRILFPFCKPLWIYTLLFEAATNIIYSFWNGICFAVIWLGSVWNVICAELLFFFFGLMRQMIISVNGCKDTVNGYIVATLILCAIDQKLRNIFPRYIYFTTFAGTIVNIFQYFVYFWLLRTISIQKRKHEYVSTIFAFVIALIDNKNSRIYFFVFEYDSTYIFLFYSKSKCDLSFNLVL